MNRSTSWSRECAHASSSGVVRMFPSRIISIETHLFVANRCLIKRLSPLIILLRIITIASRFRIFSASLSPSKLSSSITFSSFFLADTLGLGRSSICIFLRAKQLADPLLALLLRARRLHNIAQQLVLALLVDQQLKHNSTNTAVLLLEPPIQRALALSLAAYHRFLFVPLLLFRLLVPIFGNTSTVTA
eukprot:comp4109_c0_seq1/m.2500 comp4109_c0_seq1/g.2500  ORF comp4109_c0_seq1/g.2500 comp4109_c0_seq1/m.2500 type:complete len:189 (-) comp4109_c0_seq1:10-576(-)